MLQPSGLDSLGFDLLSHFQDLRTTVVIDMGRRYFSKALLVSVVVVVVDEGADLPLKIAGQEVVLQQHSVLHSLVPAFDFTLGLRMVLSVANMVHILGLEILGQMFGYVRGAVIAE